MKYFFILAICLSGCGAKSKPAVNGIQIRDVTITIGPRKIGWNSTMFPGDVDTTTYPFLMKNALGHFCLVVSSHPLRYFNPNLASTEGSVALFYTKDSALLLSRYASFKKLDAELAKDDSLLFDTFKPIK